MAKPVAACVAMVWHLDGQLQDAAKATTPVTPLRRSPMQRIDATTPAGKLQMHILGAIAEFERARIAERVKAGLDRAKANGRRLGRPRLVVGESVLASVRGLSVRQAAELGVSVATAHGWLRRGNNGL